MDILNNQEIIERNKLIAEFMDKRVLDKYPRHNAGTPEADLSYYLSSKMKFHTSWDWIMPVVEKIENLWISGARPICKIEVYQVQICHTVGYQNTDFTTNKGYNGEGKNKKINLWLAVIDFIKWYNTQNKPVTNG